MALGDSKTLNQNDATHWTVQLQDLMTLAGYRGYVYNTGGGGDRLADMTAKVPAIIANAPTGIGTTRILINIGVNDFSSLPSEATWKANLGGALDQLHTAFPSALVYVTRPWKRGFDATATTVASWNDDVIATRSSWAFVGDDERAWLKGTDNGTTMTSDGVHYSEAGKTEAANQKRAFLLP